MTPEKNREFAAELIAAAHIIAKPVLKTDDRLYVAAPEGYRINELEIEKTLPAPIRIRQSTKHEALDSFIAYLDRYSDENTVIFAKVDGDTPNFNAVIDYHSKSKASWGTHTATYTCVQTPEWRTWSGSNGKGMTQADFALFIENNAPDIVEPRSADMLLVARSISAKKNIDFSSDIRLDNGQVQFKYSETIQGSVQQGTIAIPERFKLQMAVFQGSEIYDFEARFRYRLVEGGVLKLSYDLWRANKVIEAAAKRVIAQLTARFPAMPIYIGSK